MEHFPLERFVHDENLIHLRKVLATSIDVTKRGQILKLLAEEEAQFHESPDTEK